MSWLLNILQAFSFLILLYSVVLFFFYMAIGAYAVLETRDYVHKNGFTDYRMLASSPHAPSISIIAPAYNEGATIVENVRSLLSIYYTINSSLL